MGAILAKSLREKTSQELEDQLRLEKRRLFDGIVKGSTGEAIKPHEKREGRRLIARIHTILRERTRRQELNKRIADLQPKAEKASPQFRKVVKTVEAKVAAVKAELSKEEGSRKHQPLPGRVRVKHIAAESGAAEKSAIMFAEAVRLKASIDRHDLGEA
jgi:large subunit ribosomal protein L29